MTRDRPDQERAARWLDEDLPRIAVTWLPAQRWFGGKSRRIGGVTVEDAVWLSPHAPSPVLVVLDVEYEGTALGPERSRERYAALIAFVGDVRDEPVIGRLSGEPTLHAVEAMTDAQAVTVLLRRGLVTKQSVQGTRGSEILYSDAAESVHRLLADSRDVPKVTSVGAEQSNTSVRLGSTHIFKLFRRLDDGEHPQLEIGRLLMRVGFRCAPPLEGSLVFRSRTGQVHALGALEGWISNTGDGWTHVTTQLRRAASMPNHLDAMREDMRVLGETLAAFHLALASETTAPAFAPEPVTMSDCRAWHAGLLAQVERTMSLVERHHRQWADHEAAVGRAFLDVLRLTLPHLRTINSQLAGAFSKIRIHGDFHLGQTLKTSDGFAVIDFEGEPTKPLADRRWKQCALKDVAGMLRSLDYAWATASGATSPETGVDASDDPTGCRGAFLHGYQSRALAGSATFLPPGGDAQHWKTVFELEKALYEVEYETNNRPAWVGIPLRAAVLLLDEWPES